MPTSRCIVGLVLQLAAALSPPVPCATNPLCFCQEEHFSCDDVPFYRFPETNSEVRHVVVSRARLGFLAEAALDGLPLRTLVLVASKLHQIEPRALQSMTSTLASLDLGYNEFCDIPIEALREVKVLNWLNMQNNHISELRPDMDWGLLSDSLTSLSLSNNHLTAVGSGALSPLRALTQLELDGNRLHAVWPGALPPSVAILRLSDNLLVHASCALVTSLPRLRHLHLRNNILEASSNDTCRSDQNRIEFVDLSHNHLDDRYNLAFPTQQRMKQLILDFNEFTAIPSFVLNISKVLTLSISYNKLNNLSDIMLLALKLNLEQLEVDHNKLSSIPDTFAELERLRHLSLAYNQLHQMETLPPHLHSLNVAGNFLTSFPLGLRMLGPKTLTYLDLSYNQIAYITRDIFGAWSSALTTLNLKGNIISQVAAQSFPSTMQIRELFLSFNDLQHVEPMAFSNLTTLRVLELSSGLFSGEFTASLMLKNLSRLSLDNNNIHYLSPTLVENFPSLEYLNMDFNKLTEFASETNAVNNSSNLKELRLSYNYISEIKAEFLIDLTKLQSVDVSYNRVHNVSERSFANLLNLVYLSLAGNTVECIAERAFQNLPKLQTLDLHQNNLIEFSVRYFDNVSHGVGHFSINVSYNKISSLFGGRTLAVTVLDLSHNLLESLNKDFFISFGAHIKQLIISHNRLVHIDNYNFGESLRLQIIYLDNNNISVAKRRAFAGLSALQMVDVSNNQFLQLSVEHFHNMRLLRHLRLNVNELRSLSRDVFKNTVIEHLDLSDNNLTIFPSSALSQIGFTLRKLEMARNHLEYLDSVMFQAIVFLEEFNVADNALTILSDNTFVGLARLHSLDISYNEIKTNFKELFHTLPRLRHLSMAGMDLKTIPNLHLANLTELDISYNQISSFRETNMRWLCNIRVLRLAHNKISSLLPTMWKNLSNLITLDISSNSIARIVQESFRGLNRLLHLRMENLKILESLEPRSFRSLTSLRSLELDSSTTGGVGDTVLSSVVTFIPYLESLILHICETSLDTQLRDINALKLRMLDIKGASLRSVSPDAFQSFGRQRTLQMRLSGSGVSTLPAGLLRPLTRIPHLAIDLSNNRLVAFDQAALYRNLSGWNRRTTKLVSGGLVLGGNPLRCGCSVSWVGAWLRRWTAEVGGGSRLARLAAQRSACTPHDGIGQLTRLPLLALDDEVDCYASVLSLAPDRLFLRTLAAVFWLVLLQSIA